MQSMQWKQASFKNITLSENLDKSISNGESSELFLDNVKILDSYWHSKKDQSITHLNDVLIKKYISRN